MTTPRLSQAASVFAWITLTVLALVTTATIAHAQDQSGSGTTSFSSGYGDYLYAETYIDLDIDSDLNADAYAEMVNVYESVALGDELWMEVDLYVYGDGDVDEVSDEDSDDVRAEDYFPANPWTSYEADGEYYVCASESDEWGYNCFNVTYMDVQVETTATQPNIDGTDPSSITSGDSGTMYIYGENLTNSDGSAPSVSFTLFSDSSSSDIQFGSVYVDSSYQLEVPFSSSYGVQNDEWGSIVVSTDGGTATGPDFLIQAAPPLSTSINVSPSLWQAGQVTLINITGANMGSNPGVTVDVPDISINAVHLLADGSISALASVPYNEQASSTTLTVTTGLGEQYGSATAQIWIQNNISYQYQLSPNPLNLSTGDTNTSISITSSSGATLFNTNLTSSLSSNNASNCAASLSFQNPSGPNSVVTASPADCSGVFNITGAVNGTTSVGSVIVPAQIMIQTLVGEAGGQTTPGDASMASVLLVAQNRFNDSAFPGGLAATWQAVLVPSQFYGASNTTSNGQEPELDTAAAVFAGTTNVSIPPGCEGYWSPTSAQFATLQTWAGLQAGSISDSSWPSSVGAPRLPDWNGQPKQVVIKSSIANNARGGNYANAPAFVLFQLAPSASAPAVITIP